MHRGVVAALLQLLLRRMENFPDSSSDVSWLHTRQVSSLNTDSDGPLLGYVL